VRDPAQAGAGGSGDPALCDRADKEVEELTGDISRNRTLFCSKDYVLSGYVKVLDGVTLTIQPGTRLRGRGSVGTTQPPGTLLVLPGGKLEANGRADAPIVFTSASETPARGDWGGVALLGNAPINRKDEQGMPLLGELDGVVEPITYGGLDRDDSSGILKYVRIEYAGLSLALGSELNGLTLAGVGRGTVIDYVQVRETVDDCFAFSGGNVDAKHLICQRAGDDGFDLEQGYAGRLQFLVMQQDLQAGDFLPNGIEAENDENLLPSEPFTEPRVYNATLCGRGPQSTKDLEHYGVLLRQGTKGHFFNLIVSGFDAGLDIGDGPTVANINEGSLELGSSLFFENLTADVAHNESSGGADELEDDDEGFNENTWVDGGTGNSTVRPAAFVDCFDPKALRLRPTGAIAQGAATPPNDGFFDASATYYGAFRDESDNWAAGPWVVWDDKLGPALGPRRCVCLHRARLGQRDDEVGAGPRVVAQHDVAPVMARDVAGDAQAEAAAFGPGARRRAAEEGLEDALTIVFGHAFAFVGHLEFEPGRAAAARDAHGAPGRRVGDGVLEQVAQHSRQIVRSPQGRPGSAFERDGNPLRRRSRRDEPGRGARDLAEVDGLERVTARARAGQGEQVVGQGLQAPPRVERLGDGRLVALGVALLSQRLLQLAVVLRQRRAQLVRRVGDEALLRAHQRRELCDHVVDVAAELRHLGVARGRLDAGLEVARRDATGDRRDRRVVAREPAGGPGRDRRRPRHRDEEGDDHGAEQEALVAVEVVARGREQEPLAGVAGHGHQHPAQVLLLEREVEARVVGVAQHLGPRRRTVEGGRRAHRRAPLVVDDAVLGQGADVVGGRPRPVREREAVARGLERLGLGHAAQGLVELGALQAVEGRRHAGEGAA
ncbi:MAG TPA: hypothetical protein VFS00_16865, partial [Polyangiaceae bacterium]|nr:hypothetical protein [Polyangiaceae bacterium]